MQKAQETLTDLDRTVIERDHATGRRSIGVLLIVTGWSGGELQIAGVNVIELQTDTDQCRQIGTGLSYCLVVDAGS